MQAQQWVAATFVAACLIATAPTAVAQVKEEDRLATLAARAESAEQHARVSEEYRERAASLESRAKRLERTARQLEQGWYPHEYKAAPMHRAGYTERQQAVKARSDAREARALAQRHGQIASDIRNAP